MAKSEKNTNGENQKKRKRFAKKHKSVFLTLLFDLIFAVSAYFIARAIMFYDPRILIPVNYVRFEPMTAAVFVIVTIAMLVFFDCYNTVWKYAGRVEFIKMLFAFLTSFGTLMLFKLVVGILFQVNVWSTIIIMYITFAGLLCIGMRFITVIVNYFRHVRNWVDEKSMKKTKRTVVIGAGYTGSLAINRFINNPHEGYFPVALVDDDEEKQGQKVYGIRIEGGMDKLAEIMEKYKAEAIVIAISSLTKSQLKNIYSRCIEFDVPIKIIPAMTNASEVSNNSLSLRDIKIDELLGREEFKINRGLIDAAVKDKVVMVTGGAGSIGSELCRQALNFGCAHLVIFDMHENGMFELNEEFIKKYDASRYTLVMGTVRERKKLNETLQKHKPDIVFHAAAYKHVPMMEISATEAIKNNVFGTLNVIEECQAAGVKKFVLVSTDKAVNPANVMGASKRIAEMVLESRSLADSPMKMAAVRFGNVLGSAGSVIPTFLKQIKDGGPITLTDRNIKRYFMTIPEAVRLVLQTGALAEGGEIFVLDMGEPVYIYDLACDLVRISGLIPEKDIEIKITGLRKGEKLFEELRYGAETVDGTVHEGIFVTKSGGKPGKNFDKKLMELWDSAASEDEEKTAAAIFSIVPSTYRNMAAAEQIKTEEFINQGARENGRNGTFAESPAAGESGII